MNPFVKHFGSNNKYMNLLVYDKEILKNIMHCGIELIVYLKKYLIVNQWIIINT